LTHQSIYHREEAFRLCDSFELVLATVLELETGAGDEILHGSGDEHFARSRRSRDTGSDVNCDARDLLADDLALAGMDAGPDFESELTRARDN
jgi:hypothetical protein